MNASWKIWKKVIVAAVVALFVADLGLAFILWQTSREGADAMASQRDRLALQAKLLKADVARGEQIRQSLSGVGKEYDGFYKTAFLGSTDGYSAIDEDLGTIANKANLKSSGITFQEKPVEGRGVEEVKISDTVEGDYPAIIQFINGLERSRYFYLLSDLKLDSATTGNGIRLHLELRTYFRT
jgi:Tfp pilus assembly protein PilO